MKFFPSSGLLLALLAFPMAASAAFTTTFNNLVAGEVAGQDGWTINGDTTFENSFVVNGVSPNKFAALGGFKTNPALILPSINLVHSAGAQTAAGSSFSATFALVNRSTLASPDNFTSTTPDDLFGFTLGDASGDVFALSLRSTSANTRAVFINGTQVAGGTGILASDYASPQTYTLNVGFFVDVGGSLGYTGTVGPGILLTGAVPLKAGTTFTTVGLDWDVMNNPSSQSFLLVDGLSLVPEPGATAMSLLSIGLLAARRRR